MKISTLTLKKKNQQQQQPQQLQNQQQQQPQQQLQQQLINLMIGPMKIISRMILFHQKEMTESQNFVMLKLLTQ